MVGHQRVSEKAGELVGMEKTHIFDFRSVMSKSSSESLKLARSGNLAIYGIILFTFCRCEIFLRTLFKQRGWGTASDV